MTEAAQANETRLLADLEERLLQGYGVAAGSTAVIEALQSGRIGPRGHGYLVLGPDLREAVARCTGCRALSTELVATCPRCQASCVEASLWEELLLFALRHDITAHSVKQCPSLTACGGLAAVLPN